jgi:hypothetical protein
VAKLPQAVAADTTVEQPDRIPKWNSNAPAGLQTIVAKCLEKEPAERYQTAHEFGSGLVSGRTFSATVRPKSKSSAA